MTLQEEYKALKSKRGRKSEADKARLAELEALLSEETVSEETTESAPEGMKRIMIMNHNAGMPGGGRGGAVKVFRFDVVETTAAHAEALCNAQNSKGEPMARETNDPVTVKIEDGQRVKV